MVPIVIAHTLPSVLVTPMLQTKKDTIRMSKDNKMKITAETETETKTKEKETKTEEKEKEKKEDTKVQT